jgi:hypothetical protein
MSYPLQYDGQTFTGRRALARHLAAISGRSETACSSALVRYDEDPAAVLAA